MTETHKNGHHRSPIDRLIRPLQVFAGHELAGIGLLLGAAVVAMVWANSPFAASYDALRTTIVTVSVGDFELSKPLLRWVDDLLMTVFFFVIGLEIKRELLFGELSTPRRAMLPMAAAIGGMVVPAAIYASWNPAGPATRGWGIPMATDVAFALGIMALIGRRVPLSAKILLTALAIVDDIGAILVIAVFYTDALAWSSLGLSAAFFGVAVLANRAGVHNPFVYLVLAGIVWLGLLESGVHATLAAVLMATVIPARGRLDGPSFLQRARHELDELEATGLSPGRDLLSHEQQHIVEEVADLIDEGTAPLLRLEHAILPISTFLVLPTFALVNAGTSLGGALLPALQSSVTIGIILGLFVGKQVGIVGFSWIACRLGIAELPRGLRWQHVWGLAALGGIGFTMALFVNGLAFAGPNLPLRDAAKIGIITASVLSGVTGWIILRRGTPPA